MKKKVYTRSVPSRPPTDKERTEYYLTEYEYYTKYLSPTSREEARGDIRGFSVGTQAYSDDRKDRK